MAAHSSVLAWKVPWMEEPGYSLQTTVPGVYKELDTTERLHFTQDTKVRIAEGVWWGGGGGTWGQRTQIQPLTGSLLNTGRPFSLSVLEIGL